MDEASAPVAGSGASGGSCHAFLELVWTQSALCNTDRDTLARELGEQFGRDLVHTSEVMKEQVAAVERHDASARLAELASIPTLVVSASEDRMAPPRCGRALARAITTARYEEIQDAAHGVTIQRADEVNRLLGEHFATAERSEQTRIRDHR